MESDVSFTPDVDEVRRNNEKDKNVLNPVYINFSWKLESHN